MKSLVGWVYFGQDGATALLLAVRGGHDAIVKALVAAGADTSAPLYDACARGATAVVKVLLSVPGVNPNVVQPVCRGAHFGKT
jgi:ankyrin repeat protein